ncbi:MAG: dTDP-4-dehydrorhamnose 3,5-epimerase [Verrucomicrobiia bacterium]
MGKFKRIDTFIQGLFIIEPAVFSDERGFFMEAYNCKEFSELGINTIFVQDNHSKSIKGVIRGLHFQKKHPQAKLIRVANGTIYDVAVDLRKDSPTFGKWYGIELSSENKKQIYIPQGFAHGFLTLSEEADVLYKASDYYHPEDEYGIIWNDPDLNITWPINKIDALIISSKDKSFKTFDKIKSEL